MAYRYLLHHRVLAHPLHAQPLRHLRRRGLRRWSPRRGGELAAKVLWFLAAAVVGFLIVWCLK